MGRTFYNENTARNKPIVFFAGSKKNSEIEIVFRKSPKRSPREVFRYIDKF